MAAGLSCLLVVGREEKDSAPKGCFGALVEGRGGWGVGLFLVVDFADDFPAVGVFDEGEHVGIS